MDKAVELCGEDVRLPKMWCGDQKVCPSSPMLSLTHDWISRSQHILTFPIDGGKTLNMVAFISDRSKPEDQRTFHGAWVTPSSLGEMQKDYQGWDPMVTDLFPVSPACVWRCWLRR
jgi:hypothetical protein